MLITSLIATFGFAATISAAAVPAHSRPENRTLPLPEGRIRWHAPAEMGNFTLEGTHEELIVKIGTLKPKWQTNATYLAELQAKTHHNHTKEHLSKRSNRYNQFCNQPQFEYLGQMAMDAIEYQNIDYITKHYGNGLCEALPHSCGRFSCSYNNAIVMCNDENTPSIIPCATLAQNARFIVGYCISPREGGVYHSVEGQAFYHNPNYNVLVKHTDYKKGC